jgi:phospholipid/cholesterol/gamma-HCH transport system substrate-binding protein
METRAPFVIVGAFVLAAIAAVFGFVYWLHNTGGMGARSTYQVQFSGPVPGLLVGAGVLFNGIRVGEVTQLALAPDSPRRVDATISVATTTPVRRDTRVTLEFQGLTGVPVVALEGGAETAPGPTGVLIADPGAGQSMTQAARDALRRVDSVLAENAEPLKTTIANLQTFSEGLARNTGRIDGILAGVEKMTGGGGASAPKTLLDLQAPTSFPFAKAALRHRVVIPEPSATVMFETQRMLITPTGRDYPGFADVQWADSLPKLLQTKLIQSFENFDIAHAPLRPLDGVNADFQLLVDLRSFTVEADGAPVAVVAFAARLLDKDGKVVAAELFQDRSPFAELTPAAALAAFNTAFGGAATRLIGWMLQQP